MEARMAELVALIILLLCIWQGWYRGLIMKVYSLLRFVLLIVVTIILVPIIMPLFPSDLTGREGVSFVAALIMAAILLHIIAKVLKIVEKIPVVSTVNKLGGAALGAVMGIIIIWLILFLAGSFQENSWCRQIIAYIRESELLMSIYRFNPLAYIMKSFNFPTL